MCCRHRTVPTVCTRSFGAWLFGNKTPVSLHAAVLMVVGGVAVAIGKPLLTAMRQHRGGVDVPAPPLARANTVPDGSS